MDTISTVSSRESLLPTSQESDESQEIKYESWEPNEPSSQEEWVLLYQEALTKSNNYEISLNDHNNGWMKLCKTVHLAQDEVDSFFNCFTNAIRTMPIAAVYYSASPKKEPKGVADWKPILDLLYDKIYNNELTYESAAPFFEVTDKKFGNSSWITPTYWSTVRGFELKLMRKSNLPKEQYIQRCAETYRKQFSVPYLNMDKDWEKFKAWAKQENLDSSIKVEIQTIYFSMVEDSEKMPEIYQANNSQYAKHHLSFEEFVEGLLARNMTDAVEVQCEEMISKQPQNLCFYLILLNALKKMDILKNPEIEEKLMHVIRRGLRFWKRCCCEGLISHFIDTSLFVCAKLVNVEQTLELVDDIQKQFPLSHSLEIWFSSRRTIMVVVRDLIQSGQLQVSDLQRIFEKLLLPMNLDFYLKNKIPEDIKDMHYYDCALILKLVELFKVFTLSNKIIKGLSWKETVQFWEESFLSNNNPLVMLAYTTFTRAHGSVEEADQGFKTALSRVSSVNENPQTSTKEARKCHVQLLKNYLQFKMVDGDLSDQMNVSEQLCKMQTKFSLTYCESYSLQNTDFDLPDVYALSEHWASGATYALPSIASDDTIVRELRTLKVISDDALSEKSVIVGGYPMFISNLSFKAKDSDITKAFEERGINVVRIDLNRNSQGDNYGYGTVELESEEEVNLAVSTMDRIKILGRDTFLSYYRDDKRSSSQKSFHSSRKSSNTSQKSSNSSQKSLSQKSSSQKSSSVGSDHSKQPTLLIITHLPSDWGCTKKLESVLSPYGHIKLITLDENDDKEEPFTARVEFHMAADADNVYTQWQAENLFIGLGVNIRKGYVPRKNAHPRGGKNKDGKSKERVKKETNPKEPNSGEAAQSSTDQIGPSLPEEGAESVKKGKEPPRQSLAFVPQQLRRAGQSSLKRSMRERLTMPPIVQKSVEEMDTSEPDTTVSSSSRNVPSKQRSPPIKKGRKETEKTSEEEQGPVENPDETPSLTNEDFQKMYRKDPQ